VFLNKLLFFNTQLILNMDLFFLAFISNIMLHINAKKLQNQYPTSDATKEVSLLYKYIYSLTTTIFFVMNGIFVAVGEVENNMCARAALYLNTALIIFQRSIT